MTQPCPCQLGYRPSTAYRRGCRCDHTRTIVNRHEKHRANGATPPPYTDATGTSRRLQALAAIGWSSDSLTTHTGITTRYLSNLRTRCRHQVRRETAELIRRVYDQLWNQPGPSQHMRARANHFRWAPPMAWDDHAIDDPTATPQHGTPGRTGPRGRIDLDDITHLEFFGYSRRQIAERLRVDPESIATALRRKAS